MVSAYFLFTTHTIRLDWRGSSQSKRLSSENHASSEDGNDQTFKHGLETGKLKKELKTSNTEADKIANYSGAGKSVENAEKEASVKGTEIKGTTTPCADDKIYVENELYDCNGIMKDANAGKALSEDDKESKPSKDEKGSEKPAVPKRIKQLKPTSSISSQNVSYADEKVREDITKNSETNELQKNENVSGKIFVNCGGTFPWTVDLFLDTYPNSSEYKIFTFLSDQSYKIMYSVFPSHTVITSEASYGNRTQTVDIKGFGSGSEVTQTVTQIDIAVWLKKNTHQSDYVILRLESKEVIEILKHLSESKAIDLVDKLYTSLIVNASTKDLDTLQEIFKQHKLKTGTWDNPAQTYSDFDELNPKHIPSPGRYMTMCKQTTDAEKFALFLFSSSASVNSLKVLRFLQNFSPDDRLRLTVFLPYQMFKAKSLDAGKLFRTFHVGMFLDVDELHNTSNVNVQYNLFKRELTFGRHLFSKHRQFLQYLLAGNNTGTRVIDKVRETLHYSVFKGGKDITYISSKVLTGQTMSIDDTGKRSGDFLLVNIDTPNTEYLVLYMLRRFAPWLLKHQDCEIFQDGEH